MSGKAECLLAIGKNKKEYFLKEPSSLKQFKVLIKLCGYNDQYIVYIVI